MSKAGAALTRLGTGTVSLLFKRPKDYAVKKLPIVKKFVLVEMRPPSAGDLPKAISQGQAIVKKLQTGAWKNVTVFQATVNFFVAFEVCMWFFVGECIGKASIFGYNVPGNYIGDGH